MCLWDLALVLQLLLLSLTFYLWLGIDKVTKEATSTLSSRQDPLWSLWHEDLPPSASWFQVGVFSPPAQPAGPTWGEAWLNKDPPLCRASLSHPLVLFMVCRYLVKCLFLFSLSLPPSLLPSLFFSLILWSPGIKQTIKINSNGIKEKLGNDRVGARQLPEHIFKFYKELQPAPAAVSWTKEATISAITDLPFGNFLVGFFLTQAFLVSLRNCSRE